MKTMLIITGPQGSGNHLWSRILALHPAVVGWQDLLQKDWIGHDCEPWYACWRDQSLLAEQDWNRSDYYVTSMSIPNMDNGQATVQDFPAFISAVRAQGLHVKVAFIGRDRNVLLHQETRLRGGKTYDIALETLQNLEPDAFLSYELLQLYRHRYLEMLSRQLDFPIAWQDPRIETLISEDTNTKYFRYVDYYWLDDLQRKTSSRWHD